MIRELILASTSPRRRQLLDEAGFAFKVEAPDVDERPLPGETPEDMARRLARAKAEAGAGRVDPEHVVLAADTLVVLGDVVLGKPDDEAHAASMLLSIAGREHRVLTGYAVVCRATAHAGDGVVESRVRIREIEPAEARAYAAGGEPLDKAGSYALQGDGGRFVTAVEGSRTNVIGLPTEAVVPALEALGVRRS